MYILPLLSSIFILFKVEKQNKWTPFLWVGIFIRDNPKFNSHKVVAKKMTETLDFACLTAWIIAIISAICNSIIEV